jgi:hypothetical protein
MLEFCVLFGLVLVGVLPILLIRYFEICELFETHKATSCPSYEVDPEGGESWINREVILEKRRVLSFIWNMVVGFAGLLSMVVAIGMAREAGEPMGLIIFLSFAFVFWLGAVNMRTFHHDENLFTILLRKKHPGAFA